MFKFLDQLFILFLTVRAALFLIGILGLLLVVAKWRQGKSTEIKALGNEALESAEFLIEELKPYLSSNSAADNPDKSE